MALVIIYVMSHLGKCIVLETFTKELAAIEVLTITGAVSYEAIYYTIII